MADLSPEEIAEQRSKANFKITAFNLAKTFVSNSGRKKVDDLKIITDFCDKILSFADNSRSKLVAIRGALDIIKDEDSKVGFDGKTWDDVKSEAQKIVDYLELEP